MCRRLWSGLVNNSKLLRCFVPIFVNKQREKSKAIYLTSYRCIVQIKHNIFNAFRKSQPFSTLQIRRKTHEEVLRGTSVEKKLL